LLWDNPFAQIIDFNDVREFWSALVIEVEGLLQLTTASLSHLLGWMNIT